MTKHKVPSEASVLVAGIARNCATRVRADVLSILDSLRDFKKISWLIIESDSQDDTLSKLQELSQELANFEHMTLGSLVYQFPLRTDRISHCRNVYLREIEDNPKYADLDYVVVADLDGVNSLLTHSGLASCWSRTDWDVCTANQKGPYYDVWALRHPTWCPSDCWDQLLFLSEFNRIPEEVHHIAVYSKMIEIPEDHPWIEVKSSFGGFGIYRVDAIRYCRYRGLREDGKQMCEHVPLHSSITERGGRIFINPKLINSGINEHTLPVLERRKLSFYFSLLYQQCVRHSKASVKRSLLKCGFNLKNRA